MNRLKNQSALLAWPKTILLACASGQLACWLISGRINPYYMDVLTKIGINVILAVSLNLINGYTGQFSLGHAGFMAVGAYTAAAVTMFAGPKILPTRPHAWLLPATARFLSGRVAHRRTGRRPGRDFWSARPRCV
jgi:ABC-type branched-subunit amino acid transport system permease subunit